MSRRSKSTKYSKQSVSSTEEAIPVLTQKDELPGVDYKNKLGPRSLRHNRLDLNSIEGEHRYLNSVKKELSKKTNVHKLQTAFQQQDSDSPSHLASKSLYVTNQFISAKFTSPLDNITDPDYIKKFKNDELTKDIPITFEEGEGSLDKNARPSVLAVNLKWRHGIQVKQQHRWTSKLTILEPNMVQTEFPYESKTKFTKQVESVCEELFGDSKQHLMILDGNECHGEFTSAASHTGGNVKAAKSDKLLEDPSPSLPYAPLGDAVTRSWKELTDLEEHKILVIPFHSRSGFDTDLTKRYQFPYKAKFTVGKKVYQHRFVLQVPLSKSPQHYGLIFTFSEDPQGHSKLRIKSLLTVYSVFPVTTKQACLESYAKAENTEEIEAEEMAAISISNKGRRTSPRNQSVKAAQNAVELLSDNLKEDKLLGCKWDKSFNLERGIAQPADDFNRYRRLYRDNLTGKKEKKKQHIQKNIRFEQV